MYTTIRERLPGRNSAGKAAASGAQPRDRVLKSLGANVYFLGLVSLLTDVSSEMVASILPLYLVLGLGFSPLQFGVIDGLYNGVSALARLVSGVLADRWRRHKEVAAAGYGLSAIAKLGMVAAGSAWGAVAAVIAVDRTGKGIRTAPRDALISLSAPTAHLGTAFGIHRAMDTFGALLGPVVAFTVLALIPGRFDVVFLLSFLFAALGVVALVLFVQNHRPAPVVTEVAAEPVKTIKPSMREALRMLRAPRFRTLSVIAALLGALTVSDAFIYLMVYERTGLAMGIFPLLFVLTALVYMVLAVPVGRIADRFGRGRVLIAGYAVLAAVYAVLLIPGGGTFELPLVVLGLATYYAATDGVLMAMASAEIPEPLRASGLAVLTTGTAASRLISSILFGALWAGIGQQSSLAIFLVGLALAVALAAFGLWRMGSNDRVDTVEAA